MPNFSYLIILPTSLNIYTYDTLNRLVEAINPLPANPLETYNYDPVGNRTDSNQNGLSQFNVANELNEDGDFTYQYDNNGNMIQKTAKVGGAVTNYEYDAENKLVRVLTSTTTVTYKYDGLGRRVEKDVVSATTKVTRYIYDNEDILLELDGSNNIAARYTHGPGIDEPLVMEKAGASFFYHADGLGSITEITDSTGLVKQQYTYSSFGKIESQLDPNFIQPYTFTAREFDPETGFYFYRARYYDSNTGRFTGEDPLFAGKPFPSANPDSSHLYAYVVNNPVNLTDPSGLGPCEDKLQDCLQAVNARQLECLANVVKVTSICLASCAVICAVVALPPSPAYPLCVTACIARTCTIVATGGAAACTGASLSGRINCVRDYNTCRKNGPC